MSHSRDNSDGRGTPATRRAGAVPPPLPERPPALPPRPASTPRATDGEGSRLPIVVGILLGVCGTAGLAAAVLTIVQDRNPAGVVESPREESPVLASTESEAAADSTAAQPPDTSAAASPADASSRPAVAPKPTPNGNATGPQSPNGGDVPRPADVAGPFDDIVRRKRRLLLPAPRNGLRAVEKSVHLAELRVSDPAKCRLRLTGSDAVLGGGHRFHLQSGPTSGSAGEPVSEWNVILETNNAIRSKQPVGAFRLDGNNLEFQWEPGASRTPSAAGLRYCLLGVEAEGHKLDCFLSEAPLVRATDWDLLQITRLNVPWERGLDPDPRELRMDISVEGMPPHELSPSEGLRIGDLAVLKLREIAADGQPGDVFAEMEITFRGTADQPTVSLQTFLFPKTVDEDGQVQAERTAASRSWLESARKDFTQRSVAQRTRERSVRMDLTQLRERVTSLTQQIALLLAKQPPAGTTTAASRAVEARIQQLENQKAKLQAEVLKLSAEEKRLAERQRVLTEFTDAWSPKMLQLLEGVETGGCIRLRVYVPLVGEGVNEKVDLVHIAVGACGE